MTFKQFSERGYSSISNLGKLVCFSQKPIENKQDKSLHKMHFKSIDSSAVVELHKLKKSSGILYEGGPYLDKPARIIIRLLFVKLNQNINKY